MSKHQIEVMGIRHVMKYRTVCIACAAVLEDDQVDDLLLANRKDKRVHECWMKPYLYDRTDARQRNTLLKLEVDFIRLGCYTDFSKTTRMSPHVYHKLLEMVHPLITRMDTQFRKAISAEERLSLTIRYLTRGDSVATLHQGYLVGESSVLPIVRDTCRAIYAVLCDDYLQVPRTAEEWQFVAQQFHDRWNVPNVIGSLDGKHVRIVKPAKSGTTFYNYKKFYSVVLFACVDADYKFIYADVGAEGRASDSTLWKNCSFKRYMDQDHNPLDLPGAGEVPGYPEPLPYYFIGDDAFEMTPKLMKPYPTTQLSMRQRIFNYRLSRARRVVENAFGILATRFRIFRREIEQTPENATVVILACIALHNFLRIEAPNEYLGRQCTDWEGRDYSQHRGTWRQEEAMPSAPPTRARNHSEIAKDQRNQLANWFMQKEGELPFQYDVVLQHDFYFQR